jgi:uncharacterized protein (DUF302 family)
MVRTFVSYEREKHMHLTTIVRTLALVALSIPLAPVARGAEPGLVTKASAHSVPETIARFERAVRAKEANGWMIFTEIDHSAAAAAKNGLTLRPRTVIVFGNPRLGTAPMEKAPTVAIDVPLKALVWQDDQEKVWLTYNSAEYLRSYVYPRHGLTMPAEGAKATDEVLASFADEATR